MNPLWFFALAIIAYEIGRRDGSRTNRSGGTFYRNGPPPTDRPKPRPSPPPPPKHRNWGTDQLFEEDSQDGRD